MAEATAEIIANTTEITTVDFTTNKTQRAIYYCDPELEYCATDRIFPENADPIDVTPYIIVGVVFMVDFIVPMGYYFGRMGVRSIDTGTTYATNWVDVTSLVLFVSTFIMFLAPFAIWPFHWLGSEALDWVEAWLIVNLVAEVMPAMVLIFWFWYFVVAIGSGIGEEEYCTGRRRNRVCDYDKTYVTHLDGWLTWLIYTLISFGSYFTVFWFAGDAVRYLRPQGGYELFFLWPSLIYDLLVTVGVAPEVNKQLTGYNQVFVHTHEEHEHEEKTEVDVNVNVNVTVEDKTETTEAPAEDSSSTEASETTEAPETTEADETPEDNVVEGGDDLIDPSESFISTF